MFCIFNKESFISAEIGIGIALKADFGRAAVAGVDLEIRVEHEDFFLQCGNEVAHRAAGQIGAADGAFKQRIAAHDNAFADEADAAGRVAGRVDDLERAAAEVYGVAFVQDDIGGRGDDGAPHVAGDGEIERRVGQHGGVVSVDGELGAGQRAQQLAVGTDVVGMAVRVDDVFHTEIELLYDGQDSICLIAGIDDDGVERFFIVEDVAVFHDRAYGQSLYFHLRSLLVLPELSVRRTL